MGGSAVSRYQGTTGSLWGGFATTRRGTVLTNTFGSNKQATISQELVAILFVCHASKTILANFLALVEAHPSLIASVDLSNSHITDTGTHISYTGHRTCI